jgi:malate dehydrogenase (oxaloacetate-decarboxylating)
VYRRAKADIAAARALTEDMKRLGYVQEPPPALLQTVLQQTLADL